MYNNFIHEQAQSIISKQEAFKNKQKTWRRNYEIKVQPILLQHYQKRVTSFIRQVGQKPIKRAITQQNQSFNHTKKFIFRNQQDWLSYRTTISKQQESQYINSRMKTAKSQYENHSKFQNTKQDFRPRAKEKEIHSPMIFSRSKSTTSKIKYRNHSQQKLPHQKIKEINQAQDQVSNSMKRNQSYLSFKSLLQDPHSSKNDHYSEGLDYFRQRKTDNIETEAQLYEKQQQLIEKKHHFKKLINMSLINKNSQSRREFRKILEKNGYTKIKKQRQSDQSSELDYLTLIVEGVGKNN